MTNETQKTLSDASMADVLAKVDEAMKNEEYDDLPEANVRPVIEPMPINEIVRKLDTLAQVAGTMQSELNRLSVQLTARLAAIKKQAV